MSKKELCVLTNMCMIYDGDRILVQDRFKEDWPGITFPGGHVEPQESFVDSVIREIKEETGLDISHVHLCGVKQFPSDDENDRYIVFCFKTNSYTGQLKSSKEGRVFWIHRNDLSLHKLAEGFEDMIEIFENDDLCENYHWLENHQWKSQNK